MLFRKHYEYENSGKKTSPEHSNEKQRRTSCVRHYYIPTGKQSVSLLFRMIRTFREGLVIKVNPSF